ncbi:MAG TPA: 2-oxoacid:ferredoxin oxidoreductase subunit alpha [Peptococcaceae bacterium]|nr:2-oxoacid:ferredoxin oxidoreductase subunit alpha [Peptococcaceae bacterium]
MALKQLPIVPSGDPGGLAESANAGVQRINRPVISDATKIDPIVILFCPDGAISLDESGFVISYKFCKGCGICAKESEGIVMVPEYTGPKGIF